MSTGFFLENVKNVRIQEKLVFVKPIYIIYEKETT